MARPLTIEEQKLITNNYKIAYSLINKAIQNKSIQRWEEDDLLGEIHIKMCQAVISYKYGEEDGGCSFGKYLGSFLHQALISFLRIKHRYDKKFILTSFIINEDEEDYNYGQNNISPPIFYNKQKTSWEEIGNLIKKVKLNPTEKEIIHLYYKKEWNFKEISNYCLISQNFVSSLFYKAIEKIHNYIEKNKIKEESYVDSS